MTNAELLKIIAEMERRIERLERQLSAEGIEEWLSPLKAAKLLSRSRYEIMCMIHESERCIEAGVPHKASWQRDRHYRITVEGRRKPTYKVNYQAVLEDMKKRADQLRVG